MCQFQLRKCSSSVACRQGLARRRQARCNGICRYAYDILRAVQQMWRKSPQGKISGVRTIFVAAHLGRNALFTVHCSPAVHQQKPLSHAVPACSSGAVPCKAAAASPTPASSLGLLARVLSTPLKPPPLPPILPRCSRCYGGSRSSARPHTGIRIIVSSRSVGRHARGCYSRRPHRPGSCNGCYTSLQQPVRCLGGGRRP